MNEISVSKGEIFEEFHSTLDGRGNKSMGFIFLFSLIGLVGRCEFATEVTNTNV